MQEQDNTNLKNVITSAMSETMKKLNDDPKFLWNYHIKIKKNWNAAKTFTTDMIEDLIYYKFLKIKYEIKEAYEYLNVPNKPIEFQYEFLYNIKTHNKFMFKIRFSTKEYGSILTIPIENVLKDNNLNISVSYDDKIILVQPNDKFLIDFNDIFAEMILTSSGPALHVYPSRFITI